MDRLQVPDALRAVATRCNVLSSEVTAGSPPPVEGASHQPSAAAVRIGHAGVGTAAATMATRLRDMGAFVAVVGSSFTAHDADSTRELSGLH